MPLARMRKILPNLGRAPEVARCARLCPDWRRLTAAYMGLSRPSYPMAFETRDGDRLTIERFEDLATAWLVFIRRDYAVPPDCRTILDVGANIGAFSLFAARRAPHARIIALEPFPETFRRLEANLARSRGVDGRIIPRMWALGDSDGTRAMQDGPMASQFRRVLADGAGGQPVEAVTLATLLDREGIGRVDLLKLDAEGAEYELVGSSPPEVLRRIDRIELEYHPDGSRADLFARLDQAGFELVKHEPGPSEEGYGNYGVASFRLARREESIRR